MGNNQMTTNWRGIPVTIGFDPTKVVGRATINTNGDIGLYVTGNELIKEFEQLIAVDQVRELSLGVSYVKPQVKPQKGSIMGEDLVYLSISFPKLSVVEAEQVLRELTKAAGLNSYNVFVTEATEDEEEN